MSQMDPVGNASSSSSTLHSYSSSGVSSAANSGINRNQQLAQRAFKDSAIYNALVLAAETTAGAIAHGTRQSRAEIRSQLAEVIAWLQKNLRQELATGSILPPTIAREYVSALRVNFLAALDTDKTLDGRDVVHVLRRLDEAEEAWKRTDRGRFISRLTGSDCADAVVAIAHDIRSPLCSILLLVDALRRSERASASSIRDRQLGLIHSAAFGLSATVSNLISAARGDGVVQGTPLPFSITETIHAVCDIVQPMCEEKGLPLKLELPEYDARIGHSSAIQQALLNLTSNALRYTDSGSVALGCAEVSDDRVEFWVEDTGPGIPDDVLERLCYGFPPEGVKLRFSSAGLGLAIVRTLVEAMGSSLQVDSGPQGTRFSFLLELPHAP